MIDEETAPLFPLLGYTVGVIDGAVAVRLEYATTREQYASREGEGQQYVMSPEHALNLAKALSETGTMALRPADVVLS
jgi:uncharacterized membrane-anchored protein YhcB (DUF1043 family)